MKLPAILMAAALIAVVAVPASAQITGESVLRSIGNQIDGQQRYRVEPTGDGLLLTEIASGRQVVAVRESNGHQLTIKGTVGNLGKLSPDARRRVLQHIALFNFSSPVGTLVVDQRTGDVSMIHYVNASLASTSAIAQVTTMMGDRVLSESRLLTH